MKNILFIVLYLGLGMSFLSAQITIIPDTAFEQRLIQLGHDSDTTVNGQVATSDIQNVTFLNLATLGPVIHDLTGIEDFTSLVNLNCANNQLTNLSLNNHPNLTVLFCHANQLTQLDVSGAPALTQLNCSDNNLSNLNVANNTGLIYLNCLNNTLNLIDVSNNVNLVSLYLSGNALSFVDISQNINLTSFLCEENMLQSLDVSNNTNLSLFMCSDNQLAELDIRNITNLNHFHATNNLPYLKICVLDETAAYNNTLWHKDLPAVYLEICHLSTITGRIAIDANLNCAVEPIEQGLLHQTIQFERVSDGQITTTSSYNNLGNYQTYLDTGTYTITVIPINTYWQPCLSSSQLVVTTLNSSLSFDASLQATVSCPLLTVDIAAPFLRRTANGSAYTVSYCNYGTVAAPNASIEVTLDPHLIYLGASIPLVSQVGLVYSYNVGALGVGQCGSFTIDVLVDSLAINRQTHCSEARIFPDSICDPIWNVPILEGVVNCQNDSVFFFLENIGSAMSGPQSYTIIEDDIAMRTGSIQLGAGQSTTILQAAKERSTYRILAEQANGFPSIYGNPILSLAVEGCNPDSSGGFNTQYITQFQNDNSAPSIAVDCQNNVTAFDPNDKQGQPLGYGNNHYIEQEDFINYKIRFQNTGTDTAFNIMIVDTLSTFFSIPELQMGSSSHQYTWLVENGNVLKVYFSNIKLVDSMTNEALSHGYFNFQIHQKPQNPIGTVINNKVSIYFDFNAPIITNTTTHTIGDQYVVVSVEQVLSPSLEVQVFPNPFDHTTTISVSGEPYNELSIKVFDLSGRFVKQAFTSSSNSIQLSREDLNSGLYIYQLLGDQKIISTGKIIVN